MKKLNKQEPVDPTLQCAPVTIREKNYNLCFNFRAIALAEKRLRQQGHDVYLLSAMAPLTFETIPQVLAAALFTHQPEMTFEEIVALVDYDNVWPLQNELRKAWFEAFPQQKEGDKNPPEPVQS